MVQKQARIHRGLITSHSSWGKEGTIVYFFCLSELYAVIMSTYELNEVAPEPVQGLPIPGSSTTSTSTLTSGQVSLGIPASLPTNGNSHPYLTRSIHILNKVQQYSIIPFSGFSILHIFGVVITPAIFGVDAGNDMIGLGREIYHVPFVEMSILISATVHVVSGIALNLTRRYYKYVKYGKSRIQRDDKDKEKEKYKDKRSKREHIDRSMKIVGNKDDVEVRDINEGLGGLSSIVGAGSRPSFTVRWFGLSPLSFSGYVFLILLMGHVFYERVRPLINDGDSSMVDLGYVAYALQNGFWKVASGLNLLVVTGTYHMLVGCNRYLGLFTLRQRRRTYVALGVLALLGIVSVWRVSCGRVFAAAAKRYAEYV